LCCLSTSDAEGLRIFRYRLGPETFGHTVVYFLIFHTDMVVVRTCEMGKPLVPLDVRF